MGRLSLLAVMLAVVVAVAAPALGQVSGPNNVIICANFAAQNARAAVAAQKDAEATLSNLLDQLNRCGVFIDDTTINNEYTTINDKDVAQKSDQEAESGNIDTAANVGNWGDNAALCAPIMQSGNNTGNDQAGQQFAQFDTTADDIKPSDNMSGLSSELAVECAPTVNQAAAS